MIRYWKKRITQVNIGFFNYYLLTTNIVSIIYPTLKKKLGVDQVEQQNVVKSSVMQEKYHNKVTHKSKDFPLRR